MPNSLYYIDLIYLVLIKESEMANREQRTNKEKKKEKKPKDLKDKK